MKHQVVSTNSLHLECSLCGKRRTLHQDMVMSAFDTPYVSFGEEECESKTVQAQLWIGDKKVGPVISLQYHTQSESENELQKAFNDLMKEYPEK